MANQSESDSPSDDSNHNNTQNSDNLKETKANPPKEESPPSVFVNSEPIREDYVQNAVRFLSHPNVKGSPVMHRRSFLEKKGLTREEIDEAFRRVPDTSPIATPPQPVTANKSSTQALQPAPSASSGAISKARGLSRFHWSHAILAVGLMCASGAGIAVLFTKSIVPRFKCWVRKVVVEEDEGVRVAVLNTTEKAIAAANTAAAAASEFSQTSQEYLIAQKEDRRCLQELRELVAVQMQEIRSMNRAILKLEGPTNANGRVMAVGQDGHGMTSLRQSYAYGKVDNDIISGGPGISSAPAIYAQPSTASHPIAYKEIMSMVQRGERPSNIREINDQPPNPNQPIPNPRIPPRPKPWETVQVNGYGSDNAVRGGDVFLGEGSTTAPWSQNGMTTTAPWSQNGMNTETEAGESGVGVERPMQQRAWVPPQPPSFAMAEAAAAIRQLPKRSTSIDREVQPMNNDEEAAESLGITGELQKITQFSESGGGSDGIEANIVGGENPAAAPHNITEIENGNEEI